MKANRNEAIAITLKWEGGYSNHPADPGGPTNWGITIADARKYWKKNATAADVKAMPKQVAIDIYANKYWKTQYYDCDSLASGVDLAVFDFGVNSGPSRARRYLDKAVGGPAHNTIDKLMDARMEFLRGLSTWKTFGVGWTRRCTDIRKESHRLASKPAVAAPVVIATGATTGAASTAHWLGFDPLMIGGIVLGVCAIGYLVYRCYKKKKNA
jgi:lysozyme family protein